MVSKAARRSRSSSSWSSRSSSNCKEVYNATTGTTSENCSRTEQELTQVWILLGVGIPLSYCFCCGYAIWKNSLTYCMFCEEKIKKKVIEEHRENCFTENLNEKMGFKEAPLPKACPYDAKHVLYQWPDRQSFTLGQWSMDSEFRCNEDGCQNPGNILHMQYNAMECEVVWGGTVRLLFSSFSWCHEMFRFPRL